MEVTNHINIADSELPQKQVSTYLTSPADGVVAAQYLANPKTVMPDRNGNCPSAYIKVFDINGLGVCEYQFSSGADGFNYGGRLFNSKKPDRNGNCPNGYYKTSDSNGKYTCERQPAF